jgi:hypothetical protein
VINRLVTALGDENANIRRHAIKILGTMGEKAGTNPMSKRTDEKRVPNASNA